MSRVKIYVFVQCMHVLFIGKSKPYLNLKTVEFREPVKLGEPVELGEEPVGLRKPVELGKPMDQGVYR